MDKLKPCPFCGKPGETDHLHDDPATTKGKIGHYAKIKPCCSMNCMGPIQLFFADELNVTLWKSMCARLEQCWNTRVPSGTVDELLDTLAAQQAEIERLTGCLKRANSLAEEMERNWYLEKEKNGIPLTDDDLPGMWSHSDFEGGAPDRLESMRAENAALRKELEALRAMVPKVNIRCVTQDGYGSTYLTVIRVETEDDGSFTAVTNHWSATTESKGNE